MVRRENKDKDEWGGKRYLNIVVVWGIYTPFLHTKGHMSWLVWGIYTPFFTWAWPKHKW
jgi:glyoxylase-like metal-dependent hydrolase (beta-lactamase superfamily II)